MRALITGASSGIGLDMAKYLSSIGYDLILVSRDKKRLEDIKRKIKTDVIIYDTDLSIMDNVYKLYDDISKYEVNVLINNAGFGLFGDYTNGNLDRELNMIDLNIKALHILTKLFINNDDTKYILNVASSAGLMKGGPLMSTYYASKSYVVDYSRGLYEELRRNKSDKSISILCPGPVNTNFNNVANVSFSIKGLDSKYVAKYAIDMMFKKKLIIIPGLSTKIGLWFMNIIPTKILLKMTYTFQKKKGSL